MQGCAHQGHDQALRHQAHAGLHREDRPIRWAAFGPVAEQQLEGHEHAPEGQQYGCVCHPALLWLPLVVLLRRCFLIVTLLAPKSLCKSRMLLCQEKLTCRLLDISSIQSVWPLQDILPRQGKRHQDNFLLDGWPGRDLVKGTERNSRPTRSLHTAGLPGRRQPIKARQV